MKRKKMIPSFFAALLMIGLCFATNNSHAQTFAGTGKMKDCCMMKDGKMMQMKDGKMTPMNSDMTCKNGVKCAKNGECTLKSGEKVRMKEGECIDTEGKITTCGVVVKDEKTETKNK
jgi:hypothetical protein